MAPLRQLDEGIIITTAANMLTRVFERPVKLARVEAISSKRRNVVLRAVAVLPGGETHSIIIKVTRSDAFDAEAKDVFFKSGLVGEWAATSLLTQTGLRTGQVPRFYAGDASLGLIVLEDLGVDHPTLVDLLLTSIPTRAEKAILDCASVLGEMNARMVGCRPAFEQIVHKAFPNAELGRKGFDFLLDSSARPIQSVLGGEIDQAELAAVARRLDDPGPWLTLVHGDLCPDNVLFKDDKPHLIDFEFARPRHALLDGIYWSMGFPTCWYAGRVSEELAGSAEQAYRAALSDGVKESADEDIYRSEIAHISVARMLMSIARHFNDAFANDRIWGNASVRDRILWWLQSSFIAMDKANVLPNTRDLVESWLANLQARWRASAFLDYYPAFSGRTLNKWFT